MTASLTPTETPTPTPTVTLQPTATIAPLYYTVVEGDWPEKIADMFGISLDELLSANGLTEKSVLQVGQELYIPTALPEPGDVMPPTPTPAPQYYVVAEGDWPEKIADQFGISLEELLSANGLTERSVLQVGQELLIPTPEPVSDITATPAPPTKQSPTAVVITEPLYYTVVEGDWPEKIANRFGITLEELLSANGLSVNAVLRVGQELLIPTPVPGEPTEPPAPTSTPQPTAAVVYVDITHTVKRGETIDIIADYYGVKWEDIARANGITKNSILSIGQELIIPNIAVEPTAQPTPGATATASSEPEATRQVVTETPQPTPTPTPGKVVYIVEQGDYLELIADNFGVTPEEIAEANGITVDSILSVGQELIIPNLIATPEPTIVPTAAPTQTPTPFKRPSPTPRPTSLESAKFLYPPAVLLAPANKTVQEGSAAIILMNWSSVGILARNQWYQIRIWKSADQKEPFLYYSKSTSWRPPVGFYSNDEAPYTIRWQVVVVESSGTPGQFTNISPVSPIYTLYWR